MEDIVICDVLTSALSIGLGDMSVYEGADKDGTFKPSNPFHDDPKTENSLLDIALENLQIITCRKGPSTYITVYTLGLCCPIDLLLEYSASTLVSTQVLT